MRIVQGSLRQRVRSRTAQVVGLFVFLAVTLGAGFLGSLATSSSVETWYTTLEKPIWTPPGALIGAVWSVLYALMAVAAWLVWRRAGMRASALPLSLYGVQLALNAGWSFLFFGLRLPGYAFFEIIVLGVSVAATLFVFWRRVPLAGMLFVPYLAWVCFAGFLNAVIWQLNR